MRQGVGDREEVLDRRALLAAAGQRAPATKLESGDRNTFRLSHHSTKISDISARVDALDAFMSRLPAETI